ncbi:uncharacterized protein [Ptychodera flava]|uniref:uncharacterized protein n=1 Tax=Ptychodera flava TaxID=63121 RepID=UPI003969DE14
MKWTYLLTVLLAQALAQEKLPTHEHHDDETEVYEDSCTAISEDAECGNNPAINGICKVKCTEVNEMVASAPDLCPKSCVCCTTSRTRCAKVYNEAFCSAGQCQDNLIQIMDSSLCPQGYVCCRQPPKGGTFRKFNFHSFASLEQTSYLAQCHLINVSMLSDYLIMHPKNKSLSRCRIHLQRFWYLCRVSSGAMTHLNREYVFLRIKIFILIA